MKRTPCSLHLWSMKPIYILALAALFGMGCEPRVACTLSFDTVGFTWTDSTHSPHHVRSIIRETQDSLEVEAMPISGFYAVASDLNRAVFYQKTYHVDVSVYDALDSLLTQNEYVITANECHIVKISGPEYLP